MLVAYPKRHERDLLSVKPPVQLEQEDRIGDLRENSGPRAKCIANFSRDAPVVVVGQGPQRSGAVT